MTSTEKSEEADQQQRLDRPRQASNNSLQSRELDIIKGLTSREAFFDENSFASSSISITREDWSKAKRIADRLYEAGITNIRRYVRFHPEILAELAPAVRILNANNAAATTYRATNVEELLYAFNAPPDLEIYNPTTGLSDVFVELIQRFSDGETQVVLEGPDTRLDGSVTFIRTTTSILEGSHGKWDRVVQTVEEIAPPSHAAEDGLALCEQFIALTSQRRMIEGVLNSLSTPGLLINAEGKVIETNNAADRFFSKDRVLKISRGHVSSLFPEDQRRLSKALKTAVGHPGSNNKQIAAQLQLLRRNSNRPYHLTIHPLPRRNYHRDTAAAAIVYITDPEDTSARGVSNVARIYKLTGAEQALCQQLIAGHPIVDAAKNLGITEGTARGRLKTIFRKTDTNSQSSLMRLLMVYRPL